MIPSTTRPSTHPAAAAANAAAGQSATARAPHHAKGKEGIAPISRAQPSEAGSVKEAPIPRSYAAASDAAARPTPVQQAVPMQAPAPVSSVGKVEGLAPAAGATAAALYSPSESAVVNINTYQGLLGIAARYDVTNISPKQMASLSQELYNSGAISMQDAAMLSFQPPQSAVNGAPPAPDTDLDYYAKWERQLTADANQGSAAGVGGDQRILNILGNLVALRESVIGAAVAGSSLASTAGVSPAPAMGAWGATGVVAATAAGGGTNSLNMGTNTGGNASNGNAYGSGMSRGAGPTMANAGASGRVTAPMHASPPSAGVGEPLESAKPVAPRMAGATPRVASAPASPTPTKVFDSTSV